MAFIEKKDPVILNIKLTSKGREQLSTGNLTFSYFALGDSEIDYEFNAATGLDPYKSNILRPTDVNPDFLSFIPMNLSGNPYNAITLSPSTYLVTNTAGSIGFFNSGATTFLTDSNHVKQPSIMIEMSGVTGGNTLSLLKSSSYGISASEPEVGDYLLIRWTLNESTTGFTINTDNPTPYLWYQISGITSGTLGGNDLVVTVDRNLPNFSGYTLTGIYAGAIVYYNHINYSGDTIFIDNSTDYIDESVLAFQENSQCPTIVYPFWNMSIIFTDEIAGVTGDTMPTPTGDRKYTQFNSVLYGGFVSYIQNQAKDDVNYKKKLGVIHYTNSSPANVYAEGFYLNTPKLEVPTIMWHKSTAKKLGVIFSAYGSPQTVTGVTSSLNTEYYDLADPEGNIVGKIFTNLKIFVIEDQELLFAMSYKSNRSWTLPEYLAYANGGGCT